MPITKRSKILKTVINNKVTSKTRGKRSTSLDRDSEYEGSSTKKSKKQLPTEDESNKLHSKAHNKCVGKSDSLAVRLKDSFFDIPCIELAKRLLGKVLVRRHEDGSLVKGKIIETECYAGGDDKASCSYGGKVTPKNKPTFMKPGTAFVYMTYGMYHCINLSSQGDGAAVLLRAVEPMEGIDKIIYNRKNFGNKKNTNKTKEFKLTELCNGPSKLCIGFNIDKKTVNEKDVCLWDEMWVENDEQNLNDIDEQHIVKSKRIGIDMVGEPWASKPLRFYIYESALYVSKRDKKSEEPVQQNLSKT